MGESKLAVPVNKCTFNMRYRNGKHSLLSTARKAGDPCKPQGVKLLPRRALCNHNAYAFREKEIHQETLVEDPASIHRALVVVCARLQPVLLHFVTAHTLSHRAYITQHAHMRARARTRKSIINASHTHAHNTETFKRSRISSGPDTRGLRSLSQPKSICKTHAIGSPAETRGSF